MNDREIQTDRQTDRQTDTQTDGQRQAERGKYRAERTKDRERGLMEIDTDTFEFLTPQLHSLDYSLYKLNKNGLEGRICIALDIAIAAR